MGTNADHEHDMMIEDSIHRAMQIDPKRGRFPCCIVWTPLPVLSWLVPFIGHIGICREDGVILDFAGPNFVCVDNFSFGSVARYIQFNKEKFCISPNPVASINEDEIGRSTWDIALQKSTQEYQHRSYNLLNCNCHSFVANCLNRLGSNSTGWNVVNLAAMIFVKGQWVDKASMVRSLLPFFIVFGIGIMIWGSTFLAFLIFFTCVLTGWFLLGTYYFKSLIHL